MKKLAVLGVLSLFSVKIWAQGHLSGDLMTNVNFYQRDPALPSNDVLQNYRSFLSGGESWLSLRYTDNEKGFTAFLRADAFHNSNLYNPTEANTGYGIGAWSLSKQIKELTITGGYIYDQVGSGILFRAYEDRGMLIDNALVGLHLRYAVYDHLFVKAFAGQQKNVLTFGRYEPIIKGINIEGDYSIGKAHITPGIGALNRTLDAESYTAVADQILTYDPDDVFTPQYNTYAFTAYNNLTAGDFSWFVEGSYKTKEAIMESSSSTKLVNSDGSVIYSTLGYARKGLAINLAGKRTEDFVLRTSPNELQFRGMLNWQPMVARMRPQRLMARYTPATLENSELALGGDVLISPNEKLDITLNYAHINTLEDEKLYREAYAELNYHGFDKWAFQVGTQVLEYNLGKYLNKDAGMVYAVTPFAEVTYRFNDKHSIRTEVEYMHTEQDAGSWVFGLVEYNIAPKWSFAVSDMYTIDLKPDNAVEIVEPTHFFNFFAAYTHGPHRLSAAYVRQVAGINCTGGVCRYEPAFKGIRLMFTSSF